MAEADESIRIEVDAAVKGVSDITKLASAFDKLDESADGADSVYTSLNKLSKIKITAGTQIKNLASGLEKLGSYTPNTKALQSVASDVNKLSKDLSTASIKVGSQVNGLLSGLRKLSGYTMSTSMNPIMDGETVAVEGYKSNPASMDAVIADVTKLDTKLKEKSVSIASDVKKLSEAMVTLNSTRVSSKKFEALGNDIATMADKLSGKSLEISSEVKTLAQAMTLFGSLDATSAGTGIDTLGTKVEKLANALSGKSTRIGSQINTLVTAMSRLTNFHVDSVGMSNLMYAVVKLSNVLGEKSVKVGTQINTLVTAMRKVNDFRMDMLGISNVIAAVQMLAENLEGTSIEVTKDVTKIVNALSKLQRMGDVSSAASGASSAVSNMANQLNSTKVGDLASAMSKVASSSNKVSTSAKGASQSVSNLSRSESKAATTSMSLTERLGALYNRLHKVASVYFVVSTLGSMFESIANAILVPINEAADFTESMNLMTTSLGEYAEGAYNYALQVQSALGINIDEFLGNQGTLMTMAKGFGVASDSAAIMADNLNRLAYDWASFYNMDVSDAFSKMQSGLAGETEAVRQLGYDVSTTKLQEVALAHGISTSVSEMTQAEKATLRYVAIMEQVSWAQGDLAKTIASPANQMRVLAAQAKVAAQAIGNVLLPILGKIIPVAVAVVKVIATLANRLAEFFGGTGIYDIDFGSGGELSDVGAAADDAADSLGDAGDAAGGTGNKASDAADKVKELKRELMGFDEINKFSSQDDSSSSGSSPSGGSGGSGGTGGGGGGISDITLPSYEWDLGDGSNEIYDKLMELADRLGEVWGDAASAVGKYLGQIGEQFAAIDWWTTLSDNFVAANRVMAETVEGIANFIGPVLVAFNVPQTIKSLIDLATAAFNDLATVIDYTGDVLGVFSENVLAPIAKVTGTTVRAAIDSLTGALKKLGDWLSSHADVCKTAIAGILGGLAGFRIASTVIKNINLIKKAIGTLHTAVEAFDTVLFVLKYGNVSNAAEAIVGLSDQFPILAEFVEKCTPKLGVFVNSTLTAVSSGVNPLKAALIGLKDVFIAGISPVTLAVTAIAAVVAAVAWWATQTEDGQKTWKAFTDSVSKTVQSMKSTVGVALDNVKSSLGILIDAVGNVIAVIGKLALGALATTIKLVANVIALVATAIAKVVEFFSPVINFIGKLALDMLTLRLKVVAEILGKLGEAIGWVADGIGGFVSGLFGIETAEGAVVDSTEEATDAASEYEQKIQDNITSINEYDDANGTLQRAMEQAGWSTEDLAKHLADTGQTVDEFVQGIEDYADSVINGFQKIDTESQISLDDMVGNLASNIQTTAEWSKNLETMMAMTGLDSSNALVQEMIAGGPEKYSSALNEIISSQENADKFRAAAEEYGNSLVNTYSTTVSNGAAEAQSGGETLVNSTATGMANASANASSTAQSVDQQTVQQFGSHYGEASDAGANLTGGFGDGVARSDMVSLAVSKAQAVCQQVVDSLNGGSGYKQAKSAGANLMGGYKDGLQSGVNSAVAVARSCMNSVNTALGSGNSSARSKGSGMMSSFREGLQSGVSSVSSLARNAAQQVQSGLGSNYWGANSAGKNEMGGFKDGLSDAASNVYDCGRSASESANNGLGSRYWDAYNSGKYFGMGFEEGISSRSSSVYWAAYNMAKRANTAVQTAIQQGSPSKVMKESGKWFDLGLKVGIDNYASKVSDAATSMAEGALDVTSEVSKLGEAVGSGFSSALSSSIDSSSLTDAVALSRSVNSQAATWSAAPARRVGSSHASTAATMDDSDMAQTLASAVAQGMVSVQMAASSSKTGSQDTTIVLRVGNEELARAVAKGQDSLARRGVVKLG